MVDFEKGLHNAISSVFPTADITGCFFHLCQSIRKKIAELGLIVDVRENAEVRQLCSMLRALAFLPLADVLTGFNLLKAEISERSPNLIPLCNYFEKTYLGEPTRGRRRAALFPPALWNVHQLTLLGHPRTNNSVEGFHNRLRAFFNVSKPSFYNFMSKLRTFIGSVEADQRDLLNNKPLSRLSTSWKLLEEKKLSALENYNNNEILQFLTIVGNFCSSF
uniref:MULE transposase domain-containing protein n=1 Tax=Panagrolaimus superbus TaxID=310955 RepID=A0A914YFB7_9BILA